MNGQQVGLLLIQLAASLFVLAFLGAYLLRMREERHRYRLFAVRDRLVYLVASGELSENNIVFKVFYSAMNSYAGELSSLTLMSYARASMAAKGELEKGNQKRLSEALQQSSPEVQQTISEFVRVVLDALRYNSPTLNLVLAFSHHCVRPFRFARRYKNFDAPVYETYRYYEDIPGRLGLA